jgi:hypothetical protein
VGVANTNWVIAAICLENPCMKSRKIQKTKRAIGFRVFACSIHHINSQWGKSIAVQSPRKKGGTISPN